MPYDTEVDLGVVRFPLGRWVNQQRRALRAGELEERRRKLLDEPEAGMVWEPGDQAWETKLAAFRSFHRAHGHLAPRQDAVWGEALDNGDGKRVPIGQHLANLRRKGGLGKDPARAADRAEQLAAIDPDWNCPWPLDWQRHYAVLRDLAETEPDHSVAGIEPGVTFNGDDLGAFIARQTRDWAQLSDEQQQRLTTLGIRPAPVLFDTQAPTGTAHASGKAQQAFQRGLTALAQWIEREGTGRPVARGHLERIMFEGQEHELKLGVWYANQKQRRDKLAPEQRTALQELGIEWA